MGGSHFKVNNSKVPIFFRISNLVLEYLEIISLSAIPSNDYSNVPELSLICLMSATESQDPRGGQACTPRNVEQKRHVTA